MLVVVMLISIATLVALPNFDALIGAGAENRAFRLVQGALTRAQDLAVIRRAPQEILLGEGVVVVSDEKPITLPDIEIIAPERIVIDRYGNVEPFEITIGTIHARANPFTGRLEQSVK